jgi:hypothetical protein
MLQRVRAIRLWLVRTVADRWGTERKLVAAGRKWGVFYALDWMTGKEIWSQKLRTATAFGFE